MGTKKEYGHLLMHRCSFCDKTEEQGERYTANEESDNIHDRHDQTNGKLPPEEFPQVLVNLPRIIQHSFPVTKGHEVLRMFHYRIEIAQ